MTLQQIQYVIEIAKYGKISQAAEALYLAQPYLSTSLKNLEEELGIHIFKRSYKGVELTSDGKEFLNYARPLVDQHAKIMEIYTHKAASSSAFTFQLSTQRYPFIIKAFFQFMEKHRPEHFDVHLREMNMYNVIGDVYNRRSDFGIIFISQATKPFISKYLSVKDIEFNLLKKISPKVYFRKTHPMASRDSVSLEEMSAYPFASFEADVSVSEDFSEELLMQTFNPNQNHFYVIDRGTMINTLTHTDAFSIGTGILSEGFAGPELVSRPITGQSESVQLGWIQLAGSKLSPDAYEFLDTVKDVLKNEN